MARIIRTEAEIASLWDEELNNCSYSSNNYSSSQRAWWKCAEGHSWDSFYSSRKKTSCPYCSGRLPVKGVNDLATTHPILIKEWGAQNHKSPDEVSSGSDYKAHWVCAKNHDNFMRVNHRVIRGCMHCGSFGDLFPDLLKEWDYEKNEGVSPLELTQKSAKKVWWKCQEGHSWEARAFSRHISGCPACSGFKIMKGVNTVSILKPWLLAYWSPNNNKDIDSVHFKNKDEHLWVCPKNHEWKGRFFSEPETDNSNPCKICCGYQVKKGINDLATTRPDLFKKWSKKNVVDPTSITEVYHKPLMWQCDKGHEWQSKLKYFLDCPYCSDLLVLAGFNDLTLTHPNLIKEWDYEKNAEPPEKYLHRNCDIVWWKCELGHSWKTAINLRAGGNKTNCPYCSNNRVYPGFNDLATLCPASLKEWHPKNVSNIYETAPNSKQEVWWQCDKGHEWKAKPSNRIKRKKRSDKEYSLFFSCPECFSKNASQNEKEIALYIQASGLKIQTGLRKIISPQELDIYVPDRKIAIEHNGIYWHNEANGKDKNYHYEKWLACKNKGIQLIQIWEDDWNHNPEAVKSMLANKLGFDAQTKAFATDTIVKVIDKSKTDKFLNKYDIPGHEDGSIRLSLQQKTPSGYKIVAVMVLEKECGETNTLNLFRFATSHSKIGGFSNLLNYVKNTYNPDSIIAFSDNCMNNGELYERNNFIIAEELPPDYMYVVKHRRVRKTNYDVKRFQSDDNLIFKEGLSREELADLNGFNRIWDAGKIKWVLNL